MIIAIVSGILYLVALTLLAIAARRRGRRAAVVSLVRARREFMRLLPRLGAGIIGAGFLARLLPQETVMAWLGHGSGLTGVAIASVAGALTPGGPVVGYSLGAAALKAGAGLPQVMAYVTGWSLYTIQRVFMWEMPLMPRAFVRVRFLVSLPFPFLVAAMAVLFSGG